MTKQEIRKNVDQLAGSERGREALRTIRHFCGFGCGLDSKNRAAAESLFAAYFAGWPGTVEDATCAAIASLQPLTVKGGAQ